jgi:hypothetical protein
VNKKQLSTYQADEVVRRLGLDEEVEDYELNELGHVYTLYDGRALVVKHDGTYYYI